MTRVGKILVVINLCLSAMFLAFAIATYSTRLDLKATFSEVQKQTSALNKLQAERTETRDRLAKQLETVNAATALVEKDAKAEQTALSEQEAQLRAAIDEQRSQVAARAAEVTDANTTLVERRKTTQQRIADLAQAKAELASRVAVRVSTADELAKTLSLLGIAESRVARLTERNQELDRR